MPFFVHYAKDRNFQTSNIFFCEPEMIFKGSLKPWNNSCKSALSLFMTQNARGGYWTNYYATVAL